MKSKDLIMNSSAGQPYSFVKEQSLPIWLSNHEPFCQGATGLQIHCISFRLESLKERGCFLMASKRNPHTSLKVFYVDSLLISH